MSPSRTIQKYFLTHGIKERETILDCVASFLISTGVKVRKDTNEFEMYNQASKNFEEFKTFSEGDLRENNYL